MELMKVTSHSEVTTQGPSVTEPVIATETVFMFVKSGKVRLDTTSGVLPIEAPALIRWDRGEKIAYSGVDYSEIIITVAAADNQPT